MTEAAHTRDRSEYANFESALKKVLSVSRTEIKTKLNLERKRKSKQTSASRVSRDRS